MIEKYLKNKKIIICCGSGGVGKTTTSACLGLRAAQLGLNVLVLTIDPAKRLADSLGIGTITNEPKEVITEEKMSGRLWAMMLDVKKTMDNIITELSTSEKQTEKILNNPIYQQFSQHLGGGQEYGGIGRLYQINNEKKYDLIILDTPPSQHAIDFLNSPAQLNDFFSQSVIKYFMPGDEKSIIGETSKIMAKGSVLMLKVMQKLTGSNFIQDLADFLSNFKGMYKSFQNEAENVTALLADMNTSFFIITGPEKPQMKESDALHKKLLEMGLQLNGIIINKCTPEFGIENEIFETVSPEIERFVNEHKKQVEYENGIIRRITDEIESEIFIKKIPVFSRDVHNIEALKDLVNELASRENYLH